MGRKQRMSFQDAMDMTPDDLPDGAFFAMAHEIAGLEYGDGFAELAGAGPQEASARCPEFKMPKRITKQLAVNGYEIVQHDAYHFTARKAGKFVADWWPHKRQWRMDGKLARGDEWQFQAALVARGQA